MSIQVPRGCRKACLTRKMNWFSDILHPCPLISQGTEKGLSYAQFLASPGKEESSQAWIASVSGPAPDFQPASALRPSFYHQLWRKKDLQSGSLLPLTLGIVSLSHLTGLPCPRRLTREDKAWRKGLNGYFFPQISHGCYSNTTFHDAEERN